MVRMLTHLLFPLDVVPDDRPDLNGIRPLVTRLAVSALLRQAFGTSPFAHPLPRAGAPPYGAEKPPSGLRVRIVTTADPCTEPAPRSFLTVFRRGP